MDNIRRAIVIITIIVLVGAGVVGFMFALDKNETTVKDEVINLNPSGGKMNTSNNQSTSETPAVTSDVSTALFVLTDDSGENADVIFTATADYVNNKISLIFYPVNMSVALKLDSEHTQFATLADFYENRGLARLSEAVGGVLAYPVSSAYAFTRKALSEFMTGFTSQDKGVSYYPPCKIEARSATGANLSIDHKQLDLSVADAIELMVFYKTYDDKYPAELYSYYDGTRTPQIKVAATLIDSFVTKQLTGLGDSASYYIEHYNSFFATLISKCKTDKPSKFYEKFGAAQKDFTAGSVSAYIVNVMSDNSGTAYVFDGSISSVVNTEGNIYTEKIGSDALAALVKSFY